MDFEKKILNDSFLKHKNELQHVFQSNSMQNLKVLEKAENERRAGNALYSKRDHDTKVHIEIFTHYSKSIALTPIESVQLAFGFGNRSAFLFHVGKYQDCIKDIDKALKITNSDPLKVKLLCRKVESLKLLSNDNYRKVMDEAEACFRKIKEDDKSKKTLAKLIDKAENLKIQQDKLIKNNRETVDDLCEKDISNSHDSVTINYNEKYGRHLIATRDFKPGEVIFTEKFYAASLNIKKWYTYCNYCLKPSWSSIPCGNCNWAMFCNEDCKDKAMRQFHDVECAVVPQNGMLGDAYSEHTHLISLRTLIVGIREVGSIGDLKTELEKVDKSLEIINKGFGQDGKFIHDSIKSIYTLKCDGVGNKFRLELFAYRALTLAMCLIKNSTLFGNNFKINSIKDLVNNEDVVFLTSLFLKIVRIKDKNCHSFPNFRQKCEYLNDTDACNENHCCQRGVGLVSWASLINHSCYPNAGRCFSEDQRIIIYALHPIRKNDQIFHTYNCVFYFDSKEERLPKLVSDFEVNCDCPACVEDWPTIDQLREKKLQRQEIELEIFRECKAIFTALDRNETVYHRKCIEVLSKAIIAAMNNLKQPSELICLLIDGLHRIFSLMHEMQPQYLKECKTSGN